MTATTPTGSILKAIDNDNDYKKLESPKENDHHITITEIAKDNIYIPEGYFSDQCDNRRREKSPLIKSGKYPVISPRLNQEVEKDEITHVIQTRKRGQTGISTQLNHNNFASEQLQDQRYTISDISKFDEITLVEKLFSDNLVPNPEWEKTLKDILISNKKSKALKQCIDRISTCRNLLSRGVKWKAETTKNLRVTDPTQIFRGLLQYESLTINQKQVESLNLITEDEKLGYDETRCSKEQLPDSIYNFYLSIFETLSTAAFRFQKQNYKKNLEELLSGNTSKNVDRNMYKLLQLTNMGILGYCLTQLRKNFLLGISDITVYKWTHNRPSVINGKAYGVPNATTCEILVDEKRTRVIQKKNFRISLQPKGQALQESPIANFTICCDAPLPKKGGKFKATITLADFTWEEGVNDVEKQIFKKAFFNLPTSEDVYKV